MWLTCAFAFYADQYNGEDCQEKNGEDDHYAHRHTSDESKASRCCMEEETHALHETHMYIHGLTLSTRASGRRDAAITSDRLEDTHAC